MFLLHLVWFGWVDIWSLVKSGGDYSPLAASTQVSSMTYDESQLYAAGPMHYVRMGEVSLEVDVPELAHLQNGYPTLHVLVIGTLARVLGSIERAWMLSHGLFPAAAWVCWMLLYRRQGATDTVSMTLATLSVWLPVGPRNALLSGNDVWIQPMEMTRTPHPSLSLMMLLALLVVLSKWLKTGGWQRALVSALLFASLFYTYYFMWLAACVAFSLIGLLLVSTQQWRVFLRFAGMLVAGMLLAMPYLSRAIEGVPATTALGGALHLMQRVGSFQREVHSLALVVALMLIIAMVIVYRLWLAQRENWELWLLAALLIGGFCGLNLQLITGYNAQHDHFINRVILPFGFALVMCAGVMMHQHFKKFACMQWCARGVMIVALALGFFRQTVVAKNVLDERRVSRERYLALSWIRDHTEADVVVGTLDEELLTLLPSVAGTWSFVPLGDRSMAANDEILLRYGCVAKLVGLSLEEVLKRFLSDTGSGVGHNCASTGYVLVMQRPLAQESLVWVKAHYAAILPKNVMTLRRLNYIVVSAADAPHVVDEHCKKVWGNVAWTVFKLEQ